MDGKVSPLLVKKEPLSEADMEKFGKKDAEAYPIHLLCVCLSVPPPSPTLISFSLLDSVLH